MNCPQCGAPKNETSNFCGNCGFDFSKLTVPAEPTAQTAPAETFSQPVTEPYPVAEPAAPKKKGFFSKKKNVVILIVAVLVIAAAIVAGVFIVKGMMIKNNPATYSVMAIKNYAEKVVEESPVAGMFKKSDNQLSLGMKFNGAINGQDINADFKLQRDTAKKEIGLSFNGKISTAGDIIVDLYSNSDKIAASYEMMGAKDSVYVNLNNLREDIKKSAFSPSGDNILNITEEQLDDFLDSYENMYNNYVLTDDSMKKFEEAREKLEKAIDEYGKVETADETITVNGKDVHARKIEFTFDKKALKGLAGEISDIAGELMDDTVFDNNDDAENALDELVSSVDNFNDNTLVVYTAYVNTQNDEIARIAFDAKDGPNSAELVISFSRDPEFRIDVDVTPSEGKALSASLYRETKGSELSYTFELSGAVKGSGTLVLDKDKQKFSLKSAGQELFSGGYKNDGKTITLSFDSASVPVLAQGGADFDVELSVGTETDIKKVDAKKNLLTMSKEEIEQLVESFSLTAGGGFTIA